MDYEDLKKNMYKQEDNGGPQRSSVLNCRSRNFQKVAIKTGRVMLMKKCNSGFFH